MYLSIGVIIITGMIAYIWSARGFFSAFLHMVSVIIAGALAFAMWEPIAHWILSTNPTGGAAGDLAWGASLAIPFCVLLIILRVASDKLVPFNLAFDTAGNVVGGLICGVVSATISAGILVISVGSMRLDTKFMDHQRVVFSPNGSLSRDGGLWFPADTITAKFYSMLSNGAFLPTDPDKTLGRLHPDLADENWLMRMSWEDGKGRNTTGADSFEVFNHYSFSSEKNPDELTDDHANDDPKDIEARIANKITPTPNPQQFVYVDGTAPSRAECTIEGYGVKFNSGGKEQSGRVIVGSAQVSLLVQRNANDPYDTVAIHPLAVISQANSRGDDVLKTEELGRWRFEGPSWIPSAREGNDTFMAFEFLVPKGAKPIAMYVKGIRSDVANLAPRTFTSQQARDQAIRDKSIKNKNGDSVKPPSRTDGAGQNVYKLSSPDTNIYLSDAIPFNTIFQKDIMHEMVIDNDTRTIISGGPSPSKWAKNEIAGMGVDRALQVRKFSINDGSMMVQVRVDAKNPFFGFLSKWAAGIDRSKGAALVDTNGAEYSPIGYFYKTNTTGEIWMYYNPQSPILSLQDKEMPIMTASRPDQELILLFVISKNTKIKSVKVGEKELAELKPELEVK
jgi:uncharacterized membrane protein required for colicin V production